MTVASTTRRSDAVGNGNTKVYFYGFRIPGADDLLVTVEDTAGFTYPLARTTDYTVAGVGSYSGGSITLVNNSQSWLNAEGNLKLNYKIAIRRRLTLTQLLDLRNRGGFYPEDHETAFDRNIMIALQQQDEIDRSVKLPETEPGTMTLPTVSQRGGRWLGFDLEGRPIAGTPSGGVPISAYMETLLDDATATIARATLGSGAVGDAVFVAETAGPVIETLRGSLAAETTPMELTDELIFRDASASTGKRITLDQFYRMPFWLPLGPAEIQPADHKIASVLNGVGVYGLTVQAIRGRLRNAVTASGTAIDFTGIPQGVRRVCVMFAGLSTNGAGGGNSSIILQIGDSSGIQTGAYLGSHISFPGPSIVPHLTGCYLMNGVVAARVMHGMIELRLLDATTRTWVFSVHTTASDTYIVEHGTCSKALASSALDRLRITTIGGTDTFDAGSVSILYD